jgi:hypothetical protein
MNLPMNSPHLVAVKTESDIGWDQREVQDTLAPRESIMFPPQQARLLLE